MMNRAKFFVMTTIVWIFLTSPVHAAEDTESAAREWSGDAAADLGWGLNRSQLLLESAIGPSPRSGTPDAGIGVSELTKWLV